MSTVHEWATLAPDASAARGHAYSLLSEDELRQLACLARARWLLRTGRDSPDGVSAREAARIERAFSEHGWDPDWLLAQREAVRRLRIEQSYNPSVEGAPSRADGTRATPRLERSRSVHEVLAHSRDRGVQPRAAASSPPGLCVESPSPIELAGGELRLVDGLLGGDATSAIVPDDIELGRAPARGEPRSVCPVRAR